MATKQKVGSVLEELLGLNPGDPNAPEKIWKVVSEQFRDLSKSELNRYRVRSHSRGSTCRY